MANEAPAFQIKNSKLSLFSLRLQTTDVLQITQQLAAKLAQNPDFFANTPVALDLSALPNTDAMLRYHLGDLVAFMREQGMVAAGVVGGSPEQRDAAVAAGLGLFPDAPTKTAIVADYAADASARASSRVEPAPVPVPVPPVAEEPTPIPAQVLPTTGRKTMVIDKPVRTGQRIYAEGADLIVLATVNAGAEIIADGNIHVYETLRGRALAGAKGEEGARIFALRMEAELLSIAGCYQTFDARLPADVADRPTQVYLEGTKLVLKALG